jgi:hypothetical protein
VPLHFAERAFALHLFLQRFQRLVDVVVAHENLDDDRSSWTPGKIKIREAGSRTYGCR